MRDIAEGARGPLAEPDIASSWHRVRGESSLQFDLPSAQPPEPPAWLRWLIDHLGWVGYLGKGIFWIALAVAFVAIVVAAIWLVRRIGWRQATPPAEDPAQWQPEARAARALLAEADAMAATGDYDAAARLLLHRSLEDVGRHRPALVHPSATTREIGGADAFPNAARTAFQPIAAAVERSLFGGRVLVREEWEAARAAYRDFALPGAWA